MNDYLCLGIINVTMYSNHWLRLGTSTAKLAFSEPKAQRSAVYNRILKSYCFNTSNYIFASYQYSDRII